MNREQKLALVIGFALVLVVGVLITDHYSAAQQAELEGGPVLDPGRTQTPQRYAGGNPLPGDWSTLDITEAAPTIDPESVVASGQPEPVRGAMPSFDDVFAPIENDNNGPLVIAQGAEGGINADVPGSSGSVTDIAERLMSRLRNGLDSAAGVPAMRIEQPKAVPVSTPPAARIVAQGEHYVQPNESLYKITERYYGQGSLWKQLAEANEGKVGRTGTIRPGVRLVLPAALGSNKLRGVPRTAQPVQPRRAAPVATPAASTYTVAKGDTLGEISIKLLGTSKRTGEIIEANKGLIDDADEIRVGMKLKIPAR